MVVKNQRSWDGSKVSADTKAKGARVWSPASLRGRLQPRFIIIIIIIIVVVVVVVVVIVIFIIIKILTYWYEIILHVHVSRSRRRMVEVNGEARFSSAIYWGIND